MGRRYYETDTMLIERIGLPAREVVRRLTRYQFHVEENEVVAQLSQLVGIVASLGSGTIGHETVHLRRDNIRRLRSSAILVNLEASTEVLYRRYLLDRSNDDLRRHSLDMRASIQKRLETRTRIHRAVCDFTVDTSRMSIDEVARIILDATTKGKVRCRFPSRFHS